MKWVLLSLLLLFVVVYAFVQTPFGQNWIAHQITNRLSKDLQTKISINHIDFSLFNRMHLEGILIEDRKGDTLLYAGDLKVKITDWFFLKKNVSLNYIGLDNAVIKFQRTDSVWRQQFIIDYFSSPSSGTASSKSNLNLNLKKAELRHVTFIKQDAWLGEDISIQVGALSLDANNLTLSGNKYEINSLFIKDPVVALKSYNQLKNYSTSIAPNITTESQEPWNNSQTLFKIGKLDIVNGTFSTDKQTERAPYSFFDGAHILFNEINASLNNSSFIGDTVFSKLNISAKERSGLEIKNLTADLRMTPTAMEFNQLDLKTNKSNIGNYFSMSYKDMNDLEYFIHRVKLSATFSNSYLDSDDIAFFAPEIRNWQKEIKLAGKIRGTIDDLVGKDIAIQAGNNTILKGDIVLTGLPSIHQTFIDLKADQLSTTYSDALQFIPSLSTVKQPDLAKLKYLNFKGSFTGFLSDFVTYGTMQTALGDIKSDLNMKLPKGQDPLYSGSIASDRFDLGAFIDDNTIGTVSMKGTVKGKGFNEKNRNTLFNGDIFELNYSNYAYKNIKVEGRLDKKLFEGLASINDENIKLKLNGIIDFNLKSPRFNFLADISDAHLRKLNLVGDSIDFTGKLNFDFTGITLDEFLGTAKITDAEIKKDGIRLPFDSLVISSSITDNQKLLTAESNEITAKIEGVFSLADLPNTFTYFMNKYYPAYIKAPKKIPVNEDFNFDIYTYYVDDYLNAFANGLTGFDNSHFKGNISLAKNEINLIAQIPQLKLSQYNFENINLVANGNLDHLELTGTTNNIKLNDSLNIPFADFQIKAGNDSSIVAIHAGTSEKMENANINALVTTYSDGLKVDFNPSTFTVNGKQWSIDKTGELLVRNNIITHGDITLSEGQQKITVKSKPSDIGNWSDIVVDLDKINLNDFSPLFLPNNRLEGLVSGKVIIEDPTGHLLINSDDINTKYLRFDNDSIGELKTILSYDNKLKELKVNGNTLNQENYLGFNVHLFFADSLKARNNIIALKAKTYPIKLLERFLGDLFSDMQGYLTGDINIAGDFGNLGVSGKGRLKDAGLKVNFTQCFYKIQDTDIELTKEKIDLDGIILTDTVTGNPIYISGGIDHESFSNMFYDLDISTRKPKSKGNINNKPVQLLKTTSQDNNQFFGNVKGTGVLQLRGPQSEMVMTINANASSTDSSFITIPSSSSRESGIADFLIERKYGREMTENDIKSNSTNIIYDVEITANPMATVKVILDDLTGDEIKGKGTGTLNIRSGTSEPLTLRGRFDIEEGDYLFTFKSFFKKPFEIRKGGNNYIEWNGDPYDANIKFEAIYNAEKVSFAPLATSFNLTSDISNARGDVYVVAKLTEKLFKPVINFSLDFPPSSVASTDPELALLVTQMQKNTNEVNRQVTYLIVFNSFAPSELSGETSTGGFSVNTISGMLLGVLSDQINKLFGNLLKSDKYNINLNTSLYNRNIVANSSTALNLGSNVNFSIGRSFFNNRFVISTGLGFDAPLSQSNIQQTIQLLPDVKLEWLINPSGTIRASFFYTTNADYLTTSTNTSTARRTGASLSFKKDFNKLGDLFRRKKKRQLNQEKTTAIENKEEE